MMQEVITVRQARATVVVSWPPGHPVDLEPILSLILPITRVDATCRVALEGEVQMVTNLALGMIHDTVERDVTVEGEPFDAEGNTD